MKKFKSFIEDENLKDFEEDLIGEKAPDTADAMKGIKQVRLALLIRLISKQRV